jgi:O-antigen ligase
VRILARLGPAALLGLPGALTVYLSFNAGGYFVGAPATVAVVLALVLVLRATLAERPLAGFSGWSISIAVPLGLFAVWMLLSGLWSDAPARALLEFQRPLLYLLTFLLFASLSRTPERLRWMLRGLALGIVVVCTVALITRLAPDVWPTRPNFARDRLSYPLTYWNALGLLAALGLTLCLHLSASTREPAPVKVAGAALIPVLVTTLFFTFSRGAIAAALLAAVAYVVIGRSRGLVGALAAALPAATIAVSAAYGADALGSGNPTVPDAISQGHHLALIVALCALGAGVVRAVLLPLDGFLMRLRLPARVRRPALIAAVAIPLVGIGIALAAADAPAYVEHQYHRFVEGDVLHRGRDARGRLTSPANNGRLEHWRVALDGFDKAPLRGNGAGTYQFLWARHKPGNFTVVDGHSLYIEVLGELGIVGLVLVASALLALLAGLVARVWRGGENRPLYAVVLALTLAWAVHAGIDWDWEAPAVTIWLFAVGGLAVSARRAKGRLWRAPRPTTRVVIALGCLALAITPLLAAVSQHHLDRSVAALQRGDCRQSIDSALDSLGALAVRPEPWEIMGYCDSRLGANALAVRALRKAVARDPGDWHFHYGLALVSAAAGKDPRPALGKAVALNPRGHVVRDASERFRAARRSSWPRIARRAPLVLR